MSEFGPNLAGLDTKGRILEAARWLFWEHGYEGTSLGDITGRADVNSGSLYYFFKTKEELLLAVLDAYTELLWPEVIEPAFRRTDDPIARIFAILEGYRQGLILTGCTHGCPIGNLALEVGDALPRARAKIASNFEGWKGWIRKCLEEAAGRLPEKSDSTALATFVLSVMEGGVMQARAHQDLAPFETSVKQLQHYFDCLLEQGRREQAKKVM